MELVVVIYLKHTDNMALTNEDKADVKGAMGKALANKVAKVTRDKRMGIEEHAARGIMKHSTSLHHIQKAQETLKKYSDKRIPKGNSARVIDPSKIGAVKDAALSKVMKRFGKYNSSTDAPRLREQLKPVYKSVERHEAKTVKKEGQTANIKGKINYFKHLDERAKRRGE